MKAKTPRGNPARTASDVRSTFAHRQGGGQHSEHGAFRKYLNCSHTCCTSQTSVWPHLSSPTLRTRFGLTQVFGKIISHGRPFFTRASHKITGHRLQGTQYVPSSVTPAVMLVTLTAVSKHSLPSSEMCATSLGERYPRFYSTYWSQLQGPKRRNVFLAIWTL
jgi:hypothetical protein